MAFYCLPRHRHLHRPLLTLHGVACPKQRFPSVRTICPYSQIRYRRRLGRPGQGLFVSADIAELKRGDCVE
jgi:hypothetical protein